ncbi:hypothetical protein [Aestuariicoccus sp. MJ-SS9]|uniref:hypothetical protein n=1 Tax=Aestuariicoccus sp. MJ-SS9 TaxID=3079855 RepID=UPI00290823FB|nr:hypothetical protein [Aestuariicoccus sp. MJ-SS9]MDU8912434.1 hypothetical protein [Aestuariicoccus sp. MJ-SS9]
MRYGLLALGLLFAPSWAMADDKAFRLAAPAALSESGLLKFILPRFALKTATRVTLVEDGAEAEAVFGADGVLAFEGLGQVWKLAVGADPDAQRFADWLRSDVGRGTVDSFAVDGAQVFSASVKEVVAVAEVSYDGDAARGEKTSLSMCGRCHVVNDTNRMNAIGSTPSFAVLKALPDWEDRFQSFYALNPHPAFTQVAEVTPPFDRTRPSPIAPVEMTLDDLENIMAFVADVPPADLGQPVQSR